MDELSTDDQLRAALEGYLAAQVGTRVEVTALRRMSDGWESDVYAFDAPAFSPVGVVGGHVLRLYYGVEAGPKALHEYHALTLLASAGYPVPRVELVEPSPETFGRSFLIMERVDGVSMGKLWRDPDAEVRRRELERFCALFARLHTLAWQGLPGAEHLPSYMLSQQLDLWKWYGKQFALESINDAMVWLDRTATQVTEQPLGLMHWDFHHENILVGEQDCAWVIDWTQLQVSDVRFDLAWTLVLLASERDVETAHAVRAGYFAQRGWDESQVAEELRFFEAAASLKRLVSVLISLKSGADSLGMRPGAEAIMSSRLGRIAMVYRQWLAITATPLPEMETMLAGHL
jgi:aminoglycoside phosphotransferase (APT) family kinase protein